jgi:uncharacterized protein YceK
MSPANTEQKFDPKHSIICCLTKTEYEHLPDFMIQNILRKQHIVVTGLDHQGMRFDEEGLATLGGLKIKRTIHGELGYLAGHCCNLTSLADLSRPNTSGTSRHTYGTLLDMKEAHKAGGKILNLLDLPLSTTYDCPRGLSSDRFAWQCTLEGPMCKKRVEYPVTETAWGLAGTSGATSYFHIDANGFATWIDVKVGSKYWILARPKQELDFASIDLFTGSYDQECANEDKWDLEAILLLPGTRL